MGSESINKRVEILKDGCINPNLDKIAKNRLVHVDGKIVKFCGLNKGDSLGYGFFKGKSVAIIGIGAGDGGKEMNLVLGECHAYNGRSVSSDKIRLNDMQFIITHGVSQTYYVVTQPSELHMRSR